MHSSAIAFADSVPRHTPADLKPRRLVLKCACFPVADRAGSFVGAACSVEENPPAVVVNSSLQGAGVVAAEAVVEHW